MSCPLSGPFPSCRRKGGSPTLRENEAIRRPPALALEGVAHAYGQQLALRDVSLAVAPGEIHALLGPNGSGKTTLIRTLAGLLTPTTGDVSVMSMDATHSSKRMRRLIGFVPSGDRSFYLRISGLENLIFFARLHGMRRRAATVRARTVLSQVGLAEAGSKKVGLYSHGMQKRLSVARALLADPPILLVDEATHDLDPDGARRVRNLIANAAMRGAAVVWATQRLEEIAGFATRVTVLNEGRISFAGTVPELIARAEPDRYVLQLRNGARGPELLSTLQQALGPLGSIEASGDVFVLGLADRAILGDALTRFAGAGVEILSCHLERPPIEDAVVALSGSGR